MLAAWWQDNDWLLKLLKLRYREVKEIGQQSLDAHPETSRIDADLLSLRGDEDDIFSDNPWSSRGFPLVSDSLSDDPLVDRPISAGGKVGRNAACPCGSGKKYKKCSLPK